MNATIDTLTRAEVAEQEARRWAEQAEAAEAAGNHLLALSLRSAQRRAAHRALTLRHAAR